MAPNPTWLALVFTAFAAGCGGDSGPSRPDYGTPLLDRPSTNETSCAVTTALINLKPRNWRMDSASLAATASGSVWAARWEVISENPYLPPSEYALTLSTVGLDGTFGGAHTVAADALSSSSSPSVVALPAGGFATLWTESGKLRFASFDDTGASVVAPKTIAAPAVYGYPGPVATVSASGNIGAAFVTESKDLYFVVLSASGEPLAGAPVRVGTGAWTADLVPANGGGFAMAWTKGLDNPSGEHALVVAKVDDAATLALPETVVESSKPGAFGFGGDTPSIIGVPGGYWLAWSEGDGGSYETGKGGYSVVRLAALDESGNKKGDPVVLRAMEDSIDEEQPSFIKYNGDIGLVWSRGSHIYTCGGCVPDHSQEFVLLDPETMGPVSKVVSVPKPEHGGLLNRHIAVLEDSIYTTVSIQYHTSADPAFVAYTCH